MKIVIIGGVTAGMTAVSKLTGGSGNHRITAYERGAFCSGGSFGLPFYLGNPGEDLSEALNLLRKCAEDAGAEVHCGCEPVAVDPDRKQVTLLERSTGRQFTDTYDRLILSVPAVHRTPEVPGAEKVGVHVMDTIEDIVFLREFIRTPYVHNITILGGSLAGLEAAKAFMKRGRFVRIIEPDRQLLADFDPEVSAKIQEELERQGVEIRLGEQVRSIEGGTFIERVRTGRGSYDTDLAIAAMGTVGDTGYLAGSHVEMNRDGMVLIDGELNTSVQDIYAVGEGTCLRTGTSSTVSLKMENLEFAKTGLTETQAKLGGMRVQTVTVFGNDRPGLCPHANAITIKMVCDGRTRQILGAQAWGRKNVISRINMFAVAIAAGMTPEQLSAVEFSYSSAVCAIWDPIQLACHSSRQ